MGLHRLLVRRSAMVYNTPRLPAAPESVKSAAFKCAWAMSGESEILELTPQFHTFLRACRPLDRADERPLKTLAHSPAARPASPPRSTSWARSSTPLPASHNSAFHTRRQPKCFGSVSLQDSSTDPAERLLVRQAERASGVSSGCPSQASGNRLGRLPEAIVTVVSVTGCCGRCWS